MSTQLPTLDLSQVVVGTKGTIDLSNCAPSSHPVFTQMPATLQVFNESGAGLLLNFRESGGGVTLPAGAWRNIAISAGEHFVDYQVSYVIAKAPVNSLLMTYYGPNEVADRIPTLGNTALKVGNQIGMGQTFDAILEAQPSVDITIFTSQSFALTATGLNLTGVGAATPGYLILGYADVDGGRQTFLDVRGNRESSATIQAYTIPANSTGNVQQFTFASVQYLTAIQIQSLNSNITITNIEVKRAVDPVGSYVSVLPASVVGSATVSSIVIKLSDYWGPEGFGNLSGSAGFTIRLTANNAAGVGATPPLTFYGVTVGYDEAKVLISYQDWNSNIYDLGVLTIGQIKTLALNFLVPIAITNPAQTNFGNIIFQTLSSVHFYNTHYTLDIEIPCIVSFLTPV